MRRIGAGAGQRGARGGWAETLPHSEVLRLGEALVYVVHDIAEIEVDPAAAGFQAVIFGHSHKPIVERREGVLYVNPGSAGPRRFSLPIAAAELQVRGASLDARVVELVRR